MLRHETALIICSVALVASISGGSQAFAAQEDAPKADIVMRSGNVLTIDAEDRIAQAIAIRGHRIVAVGTDEQLNGFIGSATEDHRWSTMTLCFSILVRARGSFSWP